MLEPLSGYLCLAERLSAGASLADAFHFGPQLEANHSVRELVEEALRHRAGTWIDQSDANAPHEASLLNLLIDKAHHQLGWAPRWDFATRWRAPWAGTGEWRKGRPQRWRVAWQIW